MKLAFLISACFFISQATALTLQKIEGIDDFVQNVNFDSEGNTYVNLDNYGSRHELYKVSPSKEIVWKIDISEDLGTVWDSLVTSQGQLYLQFFNSDLLLSPLAIVRPGSTEIQVVEEDFIDFVFTKDGNDDLLYIKGVLEGVYILRPNSTTSIPVKNLEDLWVSDREAVDVDKLGNAYLGHINGQVALLSKEAQQEEIPSATFISDPNASGSYIQDIAIDENNNLWAISADGSSVVFKKLNNDVLEVTARDENYGLYRLLPAKNKLFVYADHLTIDKNATIFYLDSNGEIVTIPDLENISLGSYLEHNGVADSEGNAYFHATRDVLSESLGPLVRISNSDATVTSIDIDVSNSVIDLVRLDFNDDVWVKTEISAFLNDLYRLKKGETVPEKVNIPSGSACSNFIRDVTPNPVTKEIYVQCVDGLYVAVED